MQDIKKLQQKCNKNQRLQGYDCLDRVVLVMHRRCRAGQVVYLIHLEQDRLDHIMSDELHPMTREMLHKVLLPPREEVINDDHTITTGNQTVHQVAPNETSSTGHQYPQTFAFQSQRNSPTCIYALVPSQNRTPRNQGRLNHPS